ncbi:MAG: tyrosine-type recombinase/integrase [Prochloraceae cyanobacterium]|nr:tyrosine-type recombinase/integrase [Prochloraceae cyanobacterium]
MKHNALIRAETDRDLIFLWLGNLSKTTKISYSSIIKQFLDFIDKPLAEVTLEDLQLWKRRLELTYKPTTIRNKLLVIKSLFSFCASVNYLNINVGSFLKAPKVKETLAQRILDFDEVKRLIGAAAGNERDLAMLSLMYGCGLRVSEVVGITWNDLKGGKVTVLGKGGQTRTVLVPLSVWKQLMELPQKSSFVFVSLKTHRQLERTGIHKIIKKYSLKAGIDPKTSSHWLRHSHASHSLEAGCSIKLLQHSLGHSSICTTEKYLHVNPNEGSSQFIDI